MQDREAGIVHDASHRAAHEVLQADATPGEDQNCESSRSVGKAICEKIRFSWIQHPPGKKRGKWEMAVTARHFCKSKVQESHQRKVQRVGDTQAKGLDQRACAEVESNHTRTDQLLPQVLASGYARRMEWPEPSASQMGEMGKGFVQVWVSEMAPTTVQRIPRTICALEIGAAIVIFAGRVRRCNSDKEHEEPCEGRLSRTVLWEGRGEIPLPDPIVANFKKAHG